MPAPALLRHLPRRATTVIMAVTALFLLLHLTTAITAASAAEHRAPAALPAAPVSTPRHLPLVTAPLAGHVTDEAGILDAATAQAAIDEAAAAGYGLWVVTTTEVDSASFDTLCDDLFFDSFLGSTDMLLVIQPESGDYCVLGEEGGDVRAYHLDAVEEAVLPELRDHDWNGAVTAAGHALATASSKALRTGLIVLGGGAGIVVTGVAGTVTWVMVRRRRTAKRAAADLDARQNAALTALVDADNAVITAAQELDYAVAQFGLTATDEHTAAITAARAEIDNGLEASRALSDACPETPASRIRLISVMEQAAARAAQAVRSSSLQLAQMRQLEAEAEQGCVDTATRAAEARASIAAARDQLAVLAAARSQEAVAPYLPGLDQAVQLTEVADGAVARAREALTADQRGTAVQHLRMAQGALAEVIELTTLATSLPQRLAQVEQDMAAQDALIAEDLADIPDLRDDEGFDAAAVDAAVLQARSAVEDAVGRRANPEAALARLVAAEVHLDEVLEAPRQSRQRLRDEERQRQRLASQLGDLSRTLASTHALIAANRAVVGPSPRSLLSRAAALEVEARQEQDLARAQALVRTAMTDARNAHTEAQNQINASLYPAGSSWGSSRGGAWGGLFDGPSSRTSYRGSGSSSSRSSSGSRSSSSRSSSRSSSSRSSSRRSSSSRSVSRRRGRF